jgi:hypothetical protein
MTSRVAPRMRHRIYETEYLGPRFRGDDVECWLNPKWFNYFWASP